MKTIPLAEIGKPYDIVQLDVPDHASLQSVSELLALNGILSRRPRQRYIEIGTYRGCALVQVHAMLPTAELHSLNILPADAKPGTRELLGPDEIGEMARARGVPYHQWLGDSRKFDFSQAAPFDAVFIDGCHDVEYVRMDTVRTLKHLRPGGVIIWHDYHDRNDLGNQVRLAVHQLDKGFFEKQIVHVEGTSLAFWESPCKST
jgi:predicted O-methyltransferase YrrM